MRFKVKANGGLGTIEAPCHQLFDDEEDEDGGDVVLDRDCKELASELWSRSVAIELTNVMSVLHVKESPEPVFISLRPIFVFLLRNALEGTYAPITT